MAKPPKIIILGAGITGLSTAYHLQQVIDNQPQLPVDYEIFEKEPMAGGLCRSVYQDGFTFDYTGHLLHLRVDYTKKLTRELLKKNYQIHKRNSWIYSKGLFTRYPFQANTYGLPINVVKECVLGFIKAKCQNSNKISFDLMKHQSFYDWIISTFGDGIAKHFMLPYNEKLWTVHPKNLSCSWLSSFIPQPTVQEVVNGALAEQRRLFGYNVNFLYPQKGGIQVLSDAFLSYTKNLNLNSKVTKVDIFNKEIEINNNFRYKFDKLISTLPLKQLIGLINEIPSIVKNAERLLRCNSVLNVNLGIARSNISDKHWIYFPEKNFVFYRVGFPMNFSPSLVPKGMSSIYTEIAYNSDGKYQILGGRYQMPEDKKEIIRRIKRDLIKAGILRRNDYILTENVLDIKNAYVIYDKNREKSLKKICPFLLENNIYSIGRYGGWRYSTMEDAIIEGKKTAERLIGKSNQNW